MNDDDLLPHYSRALDEIYRLRTALAYEAGALTAHLEYKTFPKTRRALAEEQLLRMRRAAQGESEAAYAGIESWALESARRDSRMGKLTRGQWEIGTDGPSGGAP
jgi:hypothetical protein